jgi:hypothetical protein
MKPRRHGKVKSDLMVKFTKCPPRKSSRENYPVILGCSYTLDLTFPWTSLIYPIVELSAPCTRSDDPIFEASRRDTGGGDRGFPAVLAGFWPSGPSDRCPASLWLFPAWVFRRTNKRRMHR